MQKRVLIAAEEIDLRARMARVVQSAGYTLSFADNEKRPHKLALNHKFNVAFVAASQTLGVSVLKELRVTIPKILVLTERKDEISHLSRSLFDALLLKSSSNEELADQLVIEKSTCLLEVQQSSIELSSYQTSGGGYTMRHTASRRIVMALCFGEKLIGCIPD
jgi:hypothetical protein